MRKDFFEQTQWDKRIEEHDRNLKDWQRQTHAHAVHADTHTHTRIKTHTHQSPEGQTAFVSVMRGSQRQREALLEKGLWCFPLQNH